MSNPTADGLVAYYQKLIIAQYRLKTKAAATVGALVAGIVADAIYTQVRDGFDLASAIGRQLDILGKLRGASRYFFSLNVTKVFLPLVDYDDPFAGTYPGIADYGDAVQPPSTYTMTYEDFVSNTLTDGDFRRVIMFLAAVESCDYAYSTLDVICYNFFSGNVNLKITGNMAITYQHLTSDTDDLFAIIKNMGLLPAPAGVSVATQEVANF